MKHSHMISDSRLAQMTALLAAMSSRNKLSSDGLGVFLGDGIPRQGMGDLRSMELLAALLELAEHRLSKTAE